MTDPDFLIETPRLRCRTWRDEDLKAIYALYSNPEAMRFVGDGQPLSMEQCRRWMRITRQNYESRGYGMFALDLKNENTTVAFAGFIHPDGQLMVELKYAVIDEYQGRGFATELAAALVNYGRQSLGFKKIMATVDADHHASRRILAKTGFRQVRERLDQGVRVLIYEQ